MTDFLRELPKDPWDYDTQCARCGSSLRFEACEMCDGEGWIEGTRHYHVVEHLGCPSCRGERCFPICLSSEEFCQSNPLPGREGEKRSTPEWFKVS